MGYDNHLSIYPGTAVEYANCQSFFTFKIVLYGFLHYEKYILYI